jgi:hypothetical protein
LREAHSLGGDPVDVRRPDSLLPVTAYVAVTHVVGKDEDNVGWRGGGIASIRSGQPERSRRGYAAQKVSPG